MAEESNVQGVSLTDGLSEAEAFSLLDLLVSAACTCSHIPPPPPHSNKPNRTL